MSDRHTLPTEADIRKSIPLVRGLLDYFPNALAAVAEVSLVGNEQHNPGEPIHWARGKSTDHPDCIVRHLVERGQPDSDGLGHTAKVAWRALALLEEELEEAGATPGRASKFPEDFEKEGPSRERGPSIVYHTSTPYASSWVYRNEKILQEQSDNTGLSPHAAEIKRRNLEEFTRPFISDAGHGDKMIATSQPPRSPGSSRHWRLATERTADPETLSDLLRESLRRRGVDPDEAGPPEPSREPGSICEGDEVQVNVPGSLYHERVGYVRRVIERSYDTDEEDQAAEIEVEVDFGGNQPFWLGRFYTDEVRLVQDLAVEEAVEQGPKARVRQR